MSGEFPLVCEENNNKKERCKEALEFIENVTEKAGEVQGQVLSAILTTNGDTEYLKRHGLNRTSDREAFKKCLPLISYEDIEPDIQRIVNGDTSPILSAHPVIELIISSGTSSGQQKLLPINQEDLERRIFFESLRMPAMSQYVEGLEKGKAMQFFFMRPEVKTPGGLMAHAVLVSIYKSRQFREARYYNEYTSPIETVLCTDSYQSMYSQLLCGLIQSPLVLTVGTAFALGLIKVMHFLQKHWTQLCLDIETGSLNKDIIDTSVRQAMINILHPNPGLAQLIRSECSGGSWQGIIGRLWPNTKYVSVIMTGTMAQYIPSLEYYAGELPLVSSVYCSSECSAGINLNPLCKPSEVSYTLLPNMAYFEFLPLQRNGDKQEQELVDLVDVKLGQEYELVVTTFSGLYRYKLGDVLLVTGFHNKAPHFHFVCRRNVLLSIDSDKTDERELQSAMENALKHLELNGGKLIDYTSYADTSSIPGHYVLFWEVCFSTKVIPEHLNSVLEESCIIVEESLNPVYRICRGFDKSVGPLEIRVVEGGTFDQLMDYAIERGASINQYKTPRCIKSTSVLELLNSRASVHVLHLTFGTRVEIWTCEAEKLILVDCQIGGCHIQLQTIVIVVKMVELCTQKY
ncbi:hypothetical protein KI387_030467 [Taxus chinensis]|uniref:Uncharacterized protein n=1 Tax=Taxus chinensis TaxID=29808 RepID=A0AA38CF23_TAXCH|nr:hypothetical protein KI387_030467 [Taxus chinensis]